MKCLSILNILLIAAFTTSTIAVPLSVETEHVEVSNERQGRSWTPFGDASSSRRGRFNREITETEKQQQQSVQLELETPQKSSEISQLKPEQNERQGRSWSPFGDASASRRGRFNRDIQPNSMESITTDKPNTDIPKSQPMESNERQGRSWTPFGDASSSRRGRFNRDITETEQSQKQQQSSEASQLKPKQNERQGRSWSPFGDASASRRGRFN